jgi:hypothetical protein
MIFSLKAKQRFVILAAVAGILQTLAFITPAAAKDYVPNALNIALLRQNDTSGEALLRLSTLVNLNGCPKVHPLRHEIEVNAIYLDVIVHGYAVDFSNLPNDPHFSCKQNVQYSAADIPLDRKLLEDNGIQQIRFVLGRGLGSDYYVVDLDEKHLQLTPRSQKIFKPGKTPYGGQAALSYWYYPANTLILSAPAAPKDQQDSVVAAFATARGLQKLTNIMPDFIMPPGQAGRHYYVDKADVLTEKISDPGSAVLHDGIYVRRPGPYE